jgi:hypothetical protein
MVGVFLPECFHCEILPIGQIFLPNVCPFMSIVHILVSASLVPEP